MKIASTSNSFEQLYFGWQFASVSFFSRHLLKHFKLRLTMKKMTSMTPACTTPSNDEFWLVLLAYWLNTISSTMITFSLVHARSCSFRLPWFGSSNFWKFIFHKVVQRHVLSVVKSLMTVLSQIFQRVCQWRNYENPLRIDCYQWAWCTTFLEHGVYLTGLTIGIQSLRTETGLLASVCQAYIRLLSLSK